MAVDLETLKKENLILKVAYFNALGALNRNIDETEKLKDCVASCLFYATMSAEEISENHSYTYEQAIEKIEKETNLILKEEK